MSDIPQYYIYSLADQGRIVDRLARVCQDDDEAKRIADGMLMRHQGVEVWRDTLRIYRVQPGRRGR